MIKHKVYPTNAGFVPEERTHFNGVSATRDIYKGHAVAILTLDDVQVIEHMLENIYSNDERFEDEADTIAGYLKRGKERMDKLHTLLGAFDMDSDGQLTKPEDQKIDWDSIPRD